MEPYTRWARAPRLSYSPSSPAIRHTPPRPHDRDLTTALVVRRSARRRNLEGKRPDVVIEELEGKQPRDRKHGNSPGGPGLAGSLLSPTRAW